MYTNSFVVTDTNARDSPPASSAVLGTPTQQQQEEAQHYYYWFESINDCGCKETERIQSSAYNIP